MALTIIGQRPGTGGSGGTGTPGAPGSPGAAGVSVVSASLNATTGHLILTLSDTSTTDAGELPGYRAATVNASGQLVLTTLAGASVNLGTVKGAQGIQGLPGTPGTPGTPGGKGDPGTPGAAGDPGQAATISVGQVTTLAAGAAAIVTNVGTTAAAVLNFGLPQGLRGDQGLQGIQGVPGVKGDPGTPGTAGTNGTNGTNGAAAQLTSGTISTLAAGAPATASITGTSPNYVLNLGLPQGAQGLQGIPGTAGTNGTNGQTPTLSIGTVTTLAATSAATATLTGTAPNYVLNLGLPQGYTGKSVTAASVSAANVLTFTVRDNVTGTDSTITAGTITVSGARQIRGVWSSSTAYVSGDVVSYLGSLYQATADVAASGTFQSASFTRITNDLPGTPPTRAGLVLATNSTTTGDLGYSPVAAAIAGAWTAIPLAGSTTTSGTDVAQYRVLGDSVELRGRFTNVTAASQQVVAMGTLPAGTWPPVDIQAVGFFGNGVTTCGIQISASNGNVAIYTNGAVSAGTVYVHGIRFSITAVTGNTQPAYSATFLTTQPGPWTTVALNNATAFSGNPAQYRLNGDRVELRGYFGGVTSGAFAGTVMGTLPLGARPPVAQPLLGLNSGTGTSLQVLVATDGTMQLYSPSAISNVAIGIAGLEFSVSATNPLAPTGAVGTAWTALPPISPATANASVPPQYRIVGDDVELRGLFGNVSQTANNFGKVATLPAGFRPPRDVFLTGTLVGNSGIPLSFVVSASDGTVNAYGPNTFSAATVSVAGMTFSTTA